MQVEVALPNREGNLMPGAYVQVSLPLAGADGIVIPTDALLFRGEGMKVASVDANGRVKLIAIKAGRNFGQAIEVLEGLKGSERLVLNPSDSLAEGDVVNVAAAEPAKR
jgi:hypothetical protein